MRPEHLPRGNPCLTCGVEASKHRFRSRPEHLPDGNPCSCGRPKSEHRTRPQRYHKRNKKDDAPRLYLGIDGEGQGRDDHRYVLLAASDESGEHAYCISPMPGLDRLTTEQCLSFIIGLPRNTKVFAYAFNYDITKILTDLPNELLYLLMRPNRRRRVFRPELGPIPIRWGEWRLNLQGTKFTVAKGSRRVTIWDLFKFFQSKFVSALLDWKVGTEESRAHMSLMKDKRSEFDKESPDDVKRYCFTECRYMATLARKLVEAHEAAGLELKVFYGAGSSGAAMLKVLGVKEKIRHAPDWAKEAIASAFFGGWFENSVIGPIEESVEGWDVSSAYPYQQTQLPCLEHAYWRKVNHGNIRYGVVRYHLPSSRESLAWGPLPFRDTEGNTSHPSSCGGGWVHAAEYRAAKQLRPDLRALEAYELVVECNCRPFESIPRYYLERLRIGKDGPGIILKLALNSCYGKLAQSVGNAPFNCWIWAGMITAGLRVMMLDMIALHKDPWSCLMIATDGLYTTEKLSPPTPVDTGTDIEVHGKRKPLGGWERKEYPRGVFAARPGVYFPLAPTEDDLKEVRGRGVGKMVILRNWQRIVDAWRDYGITRPVEIENVARFCGAKTSITSSRGGYNRADNERQKYGNWVVRKVAMSFDPMPKRKGIDKNGRGLLLHSFPPEMFSQPYKRALIEDIDKQISSTTNLLLMNREQLEEQPDNDLTEYS